MSILKLRPCEDCGCNEVVSVASESLHFACWRCTDCNAFRGWIPNPETLERQRLQRIAIDTLLSLSRLTAWEEGFLYSLRSQLQEYKLSLKQCSLLSRICFKYGVAAPQNVQQPPRKDGLFALLWGDGGQE